MPITTGTGPGGKREGAGRPFGSINRRSRALVIEAERNGLLTPVEYLLGLMRDETQPTRDRTAAAIAVAPYVHPKLSQRLVAYVNPAELSDQELLDSIKHLERIVAEGEAEPPPPDNHPSPGKVWAADDGPQPQPQPLLQRPGSHQPSPSPAPAEARRLVYDPIGKRLVQTVQ